MPNCFKCDNELNDLVEHDSELYCGACATKADLAECINCGIWFNEADLRKHNDKYHCEECADSLDLVECVECCLLFDNDDVVVDGYCVDCAVGNDYDKCDNCGEWTENTHYYDGECYCDGCFGDLDIGFCEGCDEWKDSDDLVDCGSTFYCEGCAGYRGWHKCEGCGVWDENTYEGGREVWCSDCFYDRFFICEGCSDTFDNDDGVNTDNGTFCNACVPYTDGGDYYPQFTYMKENSFSKVGSDRRYGLELESQTCPNYMELNHTGWGAKPDGSIRGKEFYSAIFRGNRGLRSIRKVCNYANEHNWVACRSCGYHLHLNMRYENVDSLKAIAYAYYATRNTWLGFVNNRRHNIPYCRAMDSNNGNVGHITDLTEWNEYCSNFNRDIWVNWQAYRAYKSLEIRLHEGTFDADKVCNWVRAHITFVDWASRLGYDDTVSIVDIMGHKELLSDIWGNAGCENLAEFYNIREAVNV